MFLDLIKSSKIGPICPTSMIFSILFIPGFDNSTGKQVQVPLFWMWSGNILADLCVAPILIEAARTATL